jgi:glyceraldehyde 3-phosphate dehydrogenase
MAKIAIHGFGRIGRTALRIAFQNNLFTPVSISDIKDVPALAALFEVDTNYGRWHEKVEAKENGFVIGGRAIPYFDSSQSLPDWGALGVDLVIDCTGRATTAQARKPILIAGPNGC